MKVAVVLCVCTCVALLSQVAEAQAAQESHLECSEAALPAFLKTVAARATVSDVVTKLFQCLEKVAASTTKTAVALVKDVTDCVNKSPQDFFKCLAKLDAPKKVAEIVNAVVDVVKCLS